MKQFKLISFLLVLITGTGILFSSCSKEEPPKKEEDAAVTATITIGSADPYHFAYDPVAVDPGFIGGPNQDGLYNVKMAFVEVKPLKSITINCYFKGEGTIQSVDDTNENGFFTVKFSMTNEEGVTSHYYDYTEGGTATMSITEFEDDHLTGTFSGTLFTESGEKMLIEDGKFNIGINRL